MDRKRGADRAVTREPLAPFATSIRAAPTDLLEQNVPREDVQHPGRSRRSAQSMSSSMPLAEKMKLAWARDNDRSAPRHDARDFDVDCEKFAYFARALCGGVLFMNGILRCRAWIWGSLLKICDGIC